jgi:hypothetical protein
VSGWSFILRSAACLYSVYHQDAFDERPADSYGDPTATRRTRSDSAGRSVMPHRDPLDTASAAMLLYIERCHLSDLRPDNLHAQHSIMVSGLVCLRDKL